MNTQYTVQFRARESARTVRSLIAAGIPLLLAVDIAADAYELSLGTVIEAWGLL